MVSFFEKDGVGIHLYNDDRVVITVKYEAWEIKRVPVNQGSSTYIL